MILNNKNRILLLVFFLIASCDFGDTNLNPTLTIDAELKELLPTAITQTVHNLSSIGGRVTGTVVQHIKGVDAQPESYTQYLIDERTLDEFWRTGLYGGAMKDCQIIIQKASESEQPYYLGIGKILMAVNLGIATTLWGDVPFEQAFEGIENLQPKYDLQENVYHAIQNLLSEAIIDFQKSPSEHPPQQEDLIFNGDKNKWMTTAYALKARYHLHLSKRNISAAQNAWTESQNGVFEELKEQPNFPFGNSINEANPFSLYAFERPDQLVMSDYLAQLLVNTNDPRLPYMAIFENGMPIIFKEDNLDLYWSQFDSPLPLISLTEINFIEAESLLRIGETNQAEEKFKTAVTAHCKQMNIPDTSYLSFIENNIHFQDKDNFEEQLEYLLIQKHLALFAQNPIECWVDYRRTGFPNISPPQGANSSLNPSMIIPRRYLYPISERNTNQINRTEAIQRQGGHLLDVDIWAFKN